MATAKPDLKLKGLECIICTETLRRPKTLQCLHSFCEDCLLRYVTSGSTIISCPLCRAKTTLPEKGVEHLTTNFVLVSLIEDISLLDKATLSGKAKVTCELCDGDNEATHRCFDCSQCICPSCLKTHKRIPVLSSHETASLEDIRQGKAPVKRQIESEKKCPEHKGDLMQYHRTPLLPYLQQSVETVMSLIEIPSDWNFLSAFPITETVFENVRSCQYTPEIDRYLSHMQLSQTRQLEDTKWELELEFGKDETYTVAYYDVCFLQPDKIAVADHKGQRIVTYNTNGNKNGVVQLNNSPYRVEAMKNMLVVVDDTEKVKVMYDMDFLFGIDSKKATTITGLVLKNNMIIVGDTKRNVLTEHHIYDGSLIRTIPVKTKPTYLAVDSNDRVVISGQYQCVVDVVDGNGVTLFTIKPSIKNQKIKYCEGVCCDGTDIYIAIKAVVVNAGHIHRYDGDGRFHSCVVQGLYDPGGISMSNDGHHMAVTDFFSVKLYRKV